LSVERSSTGWELPTMTAHCCSNMNSQLNAH
jgi:hypothetical protein